MTKLATTAEQAQLVTLAKAVAENRGWAGVHGGWILDADRNPLAHGWVELATALAQARYIAAAGIDWRRLDWAKPSAERLIAARTSQTRRETRRANTRHRCQLGS